MSEAGIENSANMDSVSSTISGIPAFASRQYAEAKAVRIDEVATVLTVSEEVKKIQII
jgi:hypothetical protein